MSLPRLVLVHGNPGHPTDFDAVAAALAPLRPGLAPARYARPAGARSVEDLLRPLDALAGAKDEPVVFVAFSFGCYLTLKWLERRGRQAAAAIFVNPTLTSGEPVSGLLKGLVDVPGVSSALLGALAPKLSGGFVKKCFAPEAADPALAARLTAGLAKGGVWKDALRAKIGQGAEPLTQNLAGAVRTLVLLRGQQDAAVAWDPQVETLRRIGLPAHSPQVFAAAGHALIWTQPSRVAAIIDQELRSLEA